MKEGSNVFDVWVLYCILLLFPISSEIVSGLQTLDLFLMLIIFLYCAANIKVSYNFLCLSFASVFLIAVNVIFVQLLGASLTVKGFFLFSKLLVLVLTFVVMDKIFRNLRYDQLKRVSYLFLAVTAVLCIWCIIKFAQAPIGRIGFPYQTVDSHVLGSLLSLLFIYFAMVMKFESSRHIIFFFLSLMAIFLAIFTTGSRSVVFVFLLWFLFVIVRMALQRRLLNVSISFLIIGMLALVVAGGSLYIDFSDLRSVQFDLQNPSEAKRIDRLFSVFTDLDQSAYLIGRGLFSAEIYYFDGTLTFLLYNFGLIGVLCFMIALCYHVKNYLIKGYQHSLFTALAMSAVLVSEFFLLSRWLIPVFVCYFLLYQQARWTYYK